MPIAWASGKYQNQTREFLLPTANSKSSCCSLGECAYRLITIMVLWSYGTSHFSPFCIVTLKFKVTTQNLDTSGPEASVCTRFQVDWELLWSWGYHVKNDFWPFCTRWNKHLRWPHQNQEAFLALPPASIHTEFQVASSHTFWDILWKANLAFCTSIFHFFCPLWPQNSSWPLHLAWC